MSDIPSNINGKDSSVLSFDLKEYLESANDASNRSRYVSIVLVIATILIFVGLNNEYMNSWMVADLRDVYMPGDKFMDSLFRHKYIGDTKDDDKYFQPQCSDLKDSNCISPAQKAKADAQEALMKIHMESRLFIRIPILGVAIHVNDLGLIGGITLVVLLLLIRTSLSREIKNLNYSFKKAYEAKRLDEFYDALAMRQLFTVPHMKGEKRNHFLSKTPYVVCLFPAFVYLILVAYDVFTAIAIPKYRSTMEGHSLASSAIAQLMFVEGICVLVICFIALRCVERQHYIYSIWDYYWDLLSPVRELCLLEPSVAGKLKGTDYHIDREDDDGVVKAKLSEDIVIAMEAERKGIVKLDNLYLFRWLWRAIKEEISPIFHFLTHALHLFSNKPVTEKPLVILIDSRLAKLFSNDKEINETLYEVLKRRDIEKAKVKDNMKPHKDDNASGSKQQ